MRGLTDEERAGLEWAADHMQALDALRPLLADLERRAVPGAGQLGDILGREGCSEIVLDRAAKAIQGILLADGDERRWWRWYRAERSRKCRRGKVGSAG